jgi:hypothetical protein
MLTSLFGDLTPLRVPAKKAERETAKPAPADFAATEVMEDAVADDDGGFAATRLLEDAAPAALQLEQDPHVTDVFVSGSPAEAIRQHFASTRAQLDQASSMITLLDPSQLWASAVVKALSDATGQPLEKLHVRERGTLRTLAVVERTTLPRRQAGPLKIYHADIRALGAEHDEIASALAERSHMTTVIIGALQPHAIDLLLRAMVQATRSPQWHCPWLMFLLPPGSEALRQRILDQPWPAHVHPAAVPVSLTGTSTVWNTVLAAWDAAHAEQPPVQPVVARNPDNAMLTRALAGLARTEGVLACGVVELAHGDLLASDSRTAQGGQLAGAAKALVAARAGHAKLSGEAELPEELLVTLPGRIQLLRAHARTPLGVVLLLDRQHANLALVRFKLMETERQLA